MSNSFLNFEKNRIAIFFKFIVEYLKLQIARFQNGNYVVEKPLVSIIIATYNRGKILCERTLPSIFNQSYSNFEIIIVGDHVIDNTEELISIISDKRLKFINLEKRTIYPTDPINRWMVAGARPRNIAISKAKGDWIYVISDDDILLPNCLEKMLQFSNTGNYESISSQYISYENSIEKIFGAEEVKNQLGFYMTGIPSWMYRRYLSFFKWNINSWKKKWNKPSDYDLQHRMKNAGVRMGYFDDVVAISPLVEGTSLTGSQAALMLSKTGKYK